MPDQQGFQARSRRFVDVELFRRVAVSSQDPAEQQDADVSLEETARREREYLRERLRRELQREPTEEELDEWLREHTEGH